MKTTIWVGGNKIMKFTKTMKRIFVSLFSALFCVTLALCFSVGSFFTASAAETDKSSGVMTSDGASIRLADDGESGIRFHVKVAADKDGNVKLDNGKTYTETQFRALASGILLIPSNKLSDGEELTVSGATTAYASGAKAANVTGSECVWKFEQSGNYYEATAYIYNIPETSYEKEFTFRGYYKVDDVTYYSAVNTRSVSYVALHEKIDDVALKGTAGKTAGWQDELLTQLDNFLPTKLVNVDKKFANKDTYLYRVGNGNPVAISSLFDTAFVKGLNVEDFAGSMDSYLKVETKQGNATGAISGTDAASATLQFSGTGVVKLTVTNPDLYTRGDNSASTTEMLFEVVDAVNATVATSATSNNVVLLNDVGVGTLDVKNGYVLYGNGFKMTITSDMTYYMFSGFIFLNNGTLDNVEIIAPNPSYSTLYNENIKDSGNYYDANAQQYGNVRSAVYADGCSAIFNSYISGGRAAIHIRTGSLEVENTTIDGGAIANIYVGSSASLTLRDATLIQEPKQATVHDTSKTVMGLSVFAEASATSFPSISLEGTLVQYAWVNGDYKKYAPSKASSIVSTVLNKTNYQHNITYKDGVERTSVCLGIAFVNLEGGAVATPTVIDNRINKSTVPYAIENVSTAYVYSYTNSNDTAEEFKTIPTYASNAQSPRAVFPTANITSLKSGMTMDSSYKGDLGWSTTITQDIAVQNGIWKWGNLSFKKNGKTLSYTIAQNETSIDETKSITLSGIFFEEYTLTITDNCVYNAKGEIVDPVSYTYPFILQTTNSNMAAPVKVAEVGGTPLLVVKSKNSDWSCALPALIGTQIQYCSPETGNIETLTLSDLTPTTKGKQNGTNNTWEYVNKTEGAKYANYKLKITCGIIQDSKGVYGMPVVVNGIMYFTISNTNGYVSTNTASRTVTIDYEFTDAYNYTLTFSKTWQFNYSDYKNGTQYSYSDFVNGDLKEASSSCLTADTLITLADGSQKAVADLQAGDMLLVFNHYTGKLDVKPFVVNAHADEEAQLYNVLNVEFSNGALWRIVGMHGIFDCTLNEYVMISWENIDEFIGHKFYYTDGVNSEYVEMTGYYITEEYTKVYSPGTADFINYFANGLLNAVPFPDTYTAGQMNYFDFDENMMYDEAQMQADIETYGLYTYEDFADYIPEELFNVFPFKYLKISVGKGLMTWDEIIHLIEVVFAA